MARTYNDIYYNDDENSTAEILDDMKKLAESVDQQIGSIKSFNNDTSQFIEQVTPLMNTLSEQVIDMHQLADTMFTELEQVKEENKQLREDLNGLPKGQASGESIDLNDSAEMRCELKISGNSKQETRSGKNKIDLAKCQIKTLNGVTSTYNKENNSITFNGTCTGNNTLFNIYIDNINAAKNATTLTAKWISGTVSGYAVARCYDEDWKQNVQVNLAQLNASNKISGTTYNDVADVFSHFDFRFDNGTVLNNFTIQLMLTDTVDTEYEMYGAMPSPDYPSEVESCGDNGSINEVICNKNLLENTAKTQTVNGVTFTVNKDGTVIANGTATAVSFIAINTFSYIANQDYMLSGCPKRWK